MLKLETEYGNLDLTASGTGAELVADLMVVIRSIYQRIDKRTQEDFKTSLISLLPTAFSDDNGSMADVLKKTDGIKVEDVDSLIDSLEDLKDVLKDLKDFGDENLCNKA